MTEKEAGMLLVIIRDLVPNFQPSKGAAKSWQRILGDKMTYEEAVKYLYEHFEESKFQPMPADIIERWREDEQVENGEHFLPPDDFGRGPRD